MREERRRKLESFIAREVSRIIQKEMRDPRVSSVSVSKVEITKELEFAKVYVSMYDDSLDKEKVVEILNRASGFFKYHIGKSLKVRRIPNIIFKLDRSIEEGDKVLAKIFDMFSDDEEEEDK